ncbi:TATA box-binding protein-associated factor RNA polymerase I subunit C isoform X1 [Triplophysa dalaica]|uniref:TATA box-binding protein-associated factor RNA polymerase I subunit C isoform X1 n=2 Tax=Triplophysa dalaica TaxID=1582913 RepID=UPI0024E00192|nr:TATA box-binding protein-associated factor RNA polymerase I subunit C isoform X1 [Triplophysa dalaica]
MDNAFPDKLFPQFYLEGPSEIKPKHGHGGWGSYGRVFDASADLCDADGVKQQSFESQRTVKGDKWVPVKPAVIPLIPPCEDAKVLHGPLPDPMNFPEHMQYFNQHHCLDAFSTMGRLLKDHWSFARKHPADVLSSKWVNRFLEGLNYKRCQLSHYWEKIRHTHQLLGDFVSDIPQSLLSELLHEELTTQREQQEFCPDLTGGVLGYLSLHQTGGGGDGCLIYPSGAALDTLNFHRVVPEYHDDKPPSFFMDSKPFAFELNGAIRQLSLGKMEDSGNVAVRSDYFCSSWVLGDSRKPHFQEVIRTKERFSCVTVSPHVPDELVVATEQGSAYLWTVRKGLQKFRQEVSNSYLNAKTAWRWCEFSCHPRVMVFADRMVAELTDARNRDCYQALFRVGKTSGCKMGERVILTKYLSESHANHHLITTQFSAYIMDERFPCVPMLKWDHMMESQPMFASVLPDTTSNNACKLLLGAPKSQEVMLFQYKGGREHACQIQGPIQKLLSPSESLSHLNLLRPHKRHIAQKRLCVPAAGLAAVQNKDYLSVFQLTETGDLFYQTLHKHQATTNANLTEPIIDTVDKDHSPALETNEVSQESSSRSRGCNSTSSPKPSKDQDFQVAWNKWFQPLFKKAASKKQHLRHQQIKTNGLIDVKVPEAYTQQKVRLKSLKRDLHDVMRKKELLSHGVTQLPPLNVTPVPDPIDPAEWQDDLSQRLAAAWDDNWKNWWDDKLGLNREEKIKALRGKRLREKQGRRRRLSLSGSFTTSVSYQDDLFEGSTIGSQYLGSDDETLEDSQGMNEDEGTMKTAKMNLALNSVEEPLKSVLRAPQKSEQEDLLEVSTRSPRATDLGVLPLANVTPTRQTSKRTMFDFGSWFGSHTSTLDMEEEVGLSFSQISATSHLSLSSPKIPQVRGLSQSSQPKKKSRMGF